MMASFAPTTRLISTTQASSKHRRSVAACWPLRARVAVAVWLVLKPWTRFTALEIHSTTSVPNSTLIPLPDTGKMATADAGAAMAGAAIRSRAPTARAPGSAARPPFRSSPRDACPLHFSSERRDLPRECRKSSRAPAAPSIVGQGAVRLGPADREVQAPNTPSGRVTAVSTSR